MTSPTGPESRDKPRGPASAMPPDFEGLVRSQGRRYFGYALRGLGCPEDAEELVADAFVEIHRRWAKVLRSRNPYAFAFKIFRDVLRSRQRIVLRRPVPRVPLEEADLPPAWQDAFTDYDARIALGEAMADLERSSPRQAECVRLHYFCGMPYAEIAETLDITVAAVKASTRLGKRRLCREDNHDTRSDRRDEGETR